MSGSLPGWATRLIGGWFFWSTSHKVQLSANITDDHVGIFCANQGKRPTAQKIWRKVVNSVEDTWEAVNSAEDTEERDHRIYGGK